MNDNYFIKRCFIWSAIFALVSFGSFIIYVFSLCPPWEANKEGFVQLRADCYWFGDISYCYVKGQDSTYIFVFEGQELTRIHNGGE